MFAPFAVKVRWGDLLNLELTEVEITLYGESLHYDELGSFVYHADCMKESILLDPKYLNSLENAECEFKGDCLLSKPKGSYSDEYFLQLKFYHPITTCILGKILLNDFLVESTDKVVNLLLILV